MNTYARIAVTMMLLSGLAPAQVRKPVGGTTVQQTTNVINDCEKRTNKFKRMVTIKTRGNTPNLKRDTDQLEQALDKVGDSWNRDHDPQKTRAFVMAAITIGQQINPYMTTVKIDSDLLNEWVAVRTELNHLAQTFNLPPVRW